MNKINKTNKERARLLYMLGFRRPEIVKAVGVARSCIDKMLEDLPEDKRVKFHLQKVDLNKLYNQYIKQ